MGVLESLLIWMFVACICWIGITALENTLAATPDGKEQNISLGTVAFGLLITPLVMVLSVIDPLITR